MTEMDDFRTRAVQALDQLNSRIDERKAGEAARLEEEKADRGTRRARSAIRGTRITIATVVTVAAATASIWDLARLTEVLGAPAVWGIAAGGALDLSWVYLVLQVFSHRDDPGKALKPYTRTNALLVLSAVLNALSGILSAGHGIGMVVLGVVSLLMPLLVKAILTPLVLGDSLAGELLITRQGRARIAAAAKDRHGRALAAFDAGFRLRSEESEFAAEAALQRQRAKFELQREATALEFQLSRESMTRAAYEAAGLTSSQVPAAVPQVPSQVPAQVPPASAPVPAIDTADGFHAAWTRDAQGTPTVVGQDENGLVPQVGSTVADSAQVPRHLTPVRGAATEQIRNLISSGITDVPEIRDRLARSGTKVPDASYVRRLVRESKNDSDSGSIGNYL